MEFLEPSPKWWKWNPFFYLDFDDDVEDTIFIGFGFNLFSIAL